MDILNMNFSDFVKSDNKKPTIKKQTIQEQKYKQIPIEEYEEDYENDDMLEEDYYDEENEDYYEEPVKPVKKVIQRPVQQQYRQIQQPTQRSVQRIIQRPKSQRIAGYAMDEEQFRRPITVSPKQLKETTIENTANSLTEAIKRKVDTVFYRFGIQGLEKLDEKILDTIEELQYPEQKQIKKPLREMRRIQTKKPIKKPRPLPLEQIKPIPQYEEPEYEEPIEEIIEEPIIEEKPIYEEPAKVITSPKPKFMQQPVEQKNKQPQITGDVNEDIMSAALSMKFGPEQQERVEMVTDDEMWNTVEAILESQPTQELVHEPQSQTIIPPITDTDQIEEQIEQKIEQPTEEIIEEPIEKPKRKRRVKQIETTEEIQNNEEEN